MFAKDFEIHKVLKVNNTNDAVFDLIKSDKCVALVAECPEHGKTRNGGCDWVINPGNLYMSIGCLSSTDHLGLLVLRTAVAVADVIKNYNPFYKWPNDIFIDGKKVCGILIEQKYGRIIIGIGINVKNSPENATHLNLYKEYDLNELPLAILNSLRICEKNLQAFQEIKQLWEEKALFLNEEIKFNDGDKIHTGKFIGVADDGGLILQYQNTTKKFCSGSICITT